MATVQNDVSNLLLKDSIRHFRPWPREIIPTATNLRGRGLSPASLHLSSPPPPHHPPTTPHPPPPPRRRRVCALRTRDSATAASRPPPPPARPRTTTTTHCAARERTTANRPRPRAQGGTACARATPPWPGHHHPHRVAERGRRGRAQTMRTACARDAAVASGPPPPLLPAPPPPRRRARMRKGRGRRARARRSRCRWSARRRRGCVRTPNGHSEDARARRPALLMQSSFNVPHYVI